MMCHKPPTTGADTQQSFSLDLNGITGINSRRDHRKALSRSDHGVQYLSHQMPDTLDRTKLRAFNSWLILKDLFRFWGWSQIDRVRYLNFPPSKVKTRMSAAGLEPATNGLKGHCSAIELRAPSEMHSNTRSSERQHDTVKKTPS